MATVKGMPIQPSEEMRGFRDVGLRIERHDEISAALAPVAADIRQTAGGDPVMMGWGILGAVRLFTPLAGMIVGGTRLREAAELVSGFGSSLVDATVLGSDLTMRGGSGTGSAAGDGDGVGTRPSLPAPVAEMLPQVVARAEHTVHEQILLPNLAEVLFELLDAREEFAEKGLLPSLATELPGLDLAQAGVGQLGCGAYFFEAGVHAAVTDSEAAGHRRGRARRRQVAASTARDSGPVLLGALMLLAGNRCLAAAG